MALQVYNYLTREKEPFKPLEKGYVAMYTCGPTVYDHSHLGHAKLYVAMDVIVRYLRYRGNKVRYVQNITDVGHLLDTGEDRIVKGARRERVEPMEVVETYARSYFEDMDALGVIRPNISPRASCHIPEQIEIIKVLLDKGYAYETAAGDVYYSVEEFADYGKLARRQLDDLEPGARIAVRDDKRHPGDFALWKHAEPEHLLRWPSPWGWGYPGWHIECSAMATKYLGDTFDIHGGGLENIFPHNECEIAQSEAATGKQFARYWLLAGSLTVDGAQMSKSKGNSITIKDALKLYSPEAIRFFILSGHYRSPMDFTRNAMLAAVKGVDRLHHTVRRLRSGVRSAVPSGTTDLSYVNGLDRHREAFATAMDDDFNTPQAIAVLFDLNREVNLLLESENPVSGGTLAAIDGMYRTLGGQVLGIIPDEFEDAAGSHMVEGLMDIILGVRDDYRSAEDWALADALRERLAKLGITVEDRPEGAAWRIEPVEE
jgi:cysteinyl-tRNA synthetase